MKTPVPADAKFRTYTFALSSLPKEFQSECERYGSNAVTTGFWEANATSEDGAREHVAGLCKMFTSLQVDPASFELLMIGKKQVARAGNRSIQWNMGQYKEPTPEVVAA